jgi:hypothetical protein
MNDIYTAALHLMLHAACTAEIALQESVSVIYLNIKQSLLLCTIGVLPCNICYYRCWRQVTSTVAGSLLTGVLAAGQHLQRLSWSTHLTTSALGKN